MSIRLMADVWDLDDPELKDSRLLTLLALADHASDDGICWPSIPRLAQRARISERQIQRVIQWLDEHGYIQIISKGNGKNHPTIYQLLIKDDKLSPKEAPKDDKLSPNDQQKDDILSPNDGRKGDIHDAKGDIGDTKGDMGVTRSINIDPSMIQNNTDANASGAVGAGLTSSAEHRSSLSDQFQALLAELKTTKNRSAKLWEIYALCFGRHEEMPSYGRLGKVATQVGGAGRLAQLFWELSARPPTGDVLSYIQKIHTKKGRESQSHGASNSNEGWQPYHSDQIITTVDINRDVSF